MAIQDVQKRRPGATEQLTLFGAAIIVLLFFVWSCVGLTLSKTLACALQMSAFSGKADIGWKRENVR